MAGKAKMLIFLGDGMGGRPLQSLGGQTTIEAANTPVLDEMAAGGACGMMSPISPGIAVGSDTGHMAILGYDPFKHYRGRGPFEARGVGLEVKPGDVAFRCNFATVDENGVIQSRRAGRIE
ncbi:MAG: phosphoglycerate mutase, partial [Armatimonadota bacterium]